MYINIYYYTQMKEEMKIHTNGQKSVRKRNTPSTIFHVINLLRSGKYA